MENNRADTVVVFAGYPEPMASFLARNPGLRSRVPFRIEFSDYSADEMLQIASLEADRRGFSVSAEAACKMSEIFASACTCSDNGNGRFCRNLIENAILSYAERVYGDAPNPSETDKTKSAQSDFVLQSADFADIRHPESPEKRPIGF